MAMIAVVSPVADPPAMVRYKDRGVSNVANQVIDLFVAAEALVTTADVKKNLCTSCGTKQQHDKGYPKCSERYQATTQGGYGLRVLTSHAQPQTAPRT